MPKKRKSAKRPHICKRIFRKIPNLAKKLKTPLLLLLAALTLDLNIVVLSTISRDYKDAWLISKVGSKVVKITRMDERGGGTGFYIKKPNGTTVLITNAHVCELKDKEGQVKVFPSIGNQEELSTGIVRKVLRQSDWTDLCEIQAVEGIEGLSLGNEPQINSQTYYTLGHPGLQPLIETEGKIAGYDLPMVVIGYIMNESDAKACTLPKNKIRTIRGLFDIPMDVCTIEIPAYVLNIRTYPGNSGSPVVDGWGRVVGVVYAGDEYGFGMAVTLSQLEKFISE